MAEGKKAFVLYADILHTVKHLSDEQAGELFKYLLRYVNDENPETENPIIKIAFEPIKQQLKRDLKKWEERAENSRENGKKGGRPKKTQKNPKKPSGLNQNPAEPKKPVTVNVTVTDTVNDNVNDIIIDNSIINSPSGESELTKKQQYEFLFDEFWKLYDKKTGREPAFKKWMKLKEKEIEQIFQHVPKYVSSTPDKQYRQNPLTYLNQKSYENEIIEQNGKRGQLSFSERHAQAIRQYHEGGIGNNNTSQFGNEVSGIFGETL